MDREPDIFLKWFSIRSITTGFVPEIFNLYDLAAFLNGISLYEDMSILCFA